MAMPRDFLSDSSEPVASQEVPGRDFLAEPEKESLHDSLKYAIPRIGTDLVKSGFEFAKRIPQDLSSIQEGIHTGAQAFRNNPSHAFNQLIAGLGEQGQNVFNTPHNLVNYMTNRLNLIPQNINQAVQMGRMPDSTQDINATLGQPANEGEQAIRAGASNSLGALGLGGFAKTLNPLNLTAKSIANDVLKTQAKNKTTYSKLYDNLWDKAKNKGFDDVSQIAPAIDIDTLRQVSPKSKIVRVEEFLDNPTLEGAHKAKSDLLKSKRKLEEQTSFDGGQKKHYDALNDAISKIDSGMFKDAAGNLNEDLASQYDKIQKGYATEVVPYNIKPINKFRKGKIRAPNLINALNRNEDFLSVAHNHPALGIRNALLPYLPYATGVGALGVGIGAGAYGANKLLGNNGSNQ